MKYALTSLAVSLAIACPAAWAQKPAMAPDDHRGHKHKPGQKHDAKKEKKSKSAARAKS